jgi:drug/metabolite transporter (DMT)-like permease
VTLLWQPVVAAVVAWVFLGERMGWQQGIGAGVVLAGMILAARK